MLFPEYWWACCSAQLTLSGMTNPTRVLGFLDIGGRWDPTLAFVLAAALVPSTLAYLKGGGEPCSSCAGLASPFFRPGFHPFILLPAAWATLAASQALSFELTRSRGSLRGIPECVHLDPAQ
jgi:hypothetical protein